MDEDGKLGLEDIIADKQLLSQMAIDFTSAHDLVVYSWLNSVESVAICDHYR
jgi:hypothetical protein